MLEEQSIIDEIEGTFASGSTEKQAEILRRVTDLFMAGAESYSEEHVDLFDGVISRIAEKIETKARAELAHRLAPIDNAPPMTVLQLAHDESIDVAGPILSRSNRLTDEDLNALADVIDEKDVLDLANGQNISRVVGKLLVRAPAKIMKLAVAYLST